MKHLINFNNSNQMVIDVLREKYKNRQSVVGISGNTLHFNAKSVATTETNEILLDWAKSNGLCLPNSTELLDIECQQLNSVFDTADAELRLMFYLEGMSFGCSGFYKIKNPDSVDRTDLENLMKDTDVEEINVISYDLTKDIYDSTAVVLDDNTTLCWYDIATYANIYGLEGYIPAVIGDPGELYLVEMYVKRSLLLLYPFYPIYLRNFYKINDIESFPSEYREDFNPVPEELLTKIDVISADVTKDINDNTAILLTDGTSLSWNDIVVYFEMGGCFISAVYNEHPISGEKNSLIIFEDYTPASSIFYNYPIENFNEFKFFTNIKSIGGCGMLPAFNGALKNIAIPNSVTSIGSYAFCECSNLTSINIPNGVKTICNDAFWNCTSLPEEIIIPDSVEYIGASVFSNCNQIKNIKLGNNIKQIDSNAFRGTRITDLNIPDSVEYIGDDIVNNQYITKPIYTSKWFVALPSDVTGEYSIPTGIKYIAGSAFINSRTSNIIIPNGVLSIGRYAFEDCRNLTEINFPDSLQTIEGGIFSNSAITKYNIPKNVTHIGGVISGHYDGNLSYITVDPQNTIYDSRNNCNALIETATDTLVEGCYNTVIPNDIKHIGYRAFYGKSMKSIIIPDSVITIGENAFGWSKITDITLGQNIISIDRDAFYTCKSLTSIVIPNKVTTLEYGVLSCCFCLTTVTLPASITKISDWAFAWDEALTNITYLGTVDQWNNINIHPGSWYACKQVITVNCTDGDIIIPAHAS